MSAGATASFSGRFLFEGAMALLIGGCLGYFDGIFSVSTEPEEVTPVAKLANDRPVAVVPDVSAQTFGHRRQPKADLLLRAHRDPWGVLAALEAEVADGEVRVYEGIYTAMFSAWAHRDPDGAIEALARIENGPLREAIEAVLNVVFDQDPTRGAEVLVEWQHHARLPKSLTDHPAEACELVPIIVASEDGADHFSAAREWAKTDPAAAFAWAQSQTGWQAMADVIGPWVKVDLEGAIKAYDSDQIQNRDTRLELAKAIAMAVGKERPAEAIEWLSQSMDGQSRRHTISKILEAWAGRDLDAAIVWTRAQERSVDQAQALQSITPAWVKADVIAAAEFVLSADTRMQSAGDSVKKIGSGQPSPLMRWVAIRTLPSKSTMLAVTTCWR
jgi:hypothetical protein